MTNFAGNKLIRRVPIRRNEESPDSSGQRTSQKEGNARDPKGVAAFTDSATEIQTSRFRFVLYREKGEKVV